MPIPTLLKFGDYQSFLNAHVEHMRSRSEAWSLGVWARQLELKSATSLSMILNGQRNPGPKLVKKFIIYFRFSQTQKRYFENLVRIKKSERDSHLATLLLEDMKRLSSDSGFQVLDHASFEAISKWYYYAIRQLVRTRGFKEDPYWIRHQFLFSVSIPEIKRALKKLEELGLLKRDASGGLVHSGVGCRTENGIAREALKQFHEAGLKNALQAIRKTPLGARENQGLVLSFNTRNLERAQEAIRQFIEKMDDSFAESSSDSVYQLNVQFFPLTRRGGQE